MVAQQRQKNKENQKRRERRGGNGEGRRVGGVNGGWVGEETSFSSFPLSSSSSSSPLLPTPNLPKKKQHNKKRDADRHTILSLILLIYLYVCSLFNQNPLQTPLCWGCRGVLSLRLIPAAPSPPLLSLSLHFQKPSFV